MRIELTPEAMRGIGPAMQPTSRPLDEDVPCPGGPLWSADDNDRQAGAWASRNFEGRYWVQEPGEDTGADHDHKNPKYTPTSDTTGSVPLVGDPGRMGSMANAEGMPPATGNQ